MLFSPTLYRVEALRQLRNPYTLAFTLAMPVAMYLLFGAGADYARLSAGHGNVSFYVMVSMGAFGTATAMSSLSSLAASEIGQGWGRQLALTPLTMPGYVVTKLLTSMSFAALSVAAVFVAGALSGAEADDAWRWAAAAALILGGGLIYGLFGTGVGLAFNADSAAALASIAITFFSFFGNVFIPLEGVLLDIAHYTPLYGYVALVRWPVTDGALIAGGSDPLWAVLLNFAAWTAAFVALARIGMLRSRRRR
ncbi:ABC transporter permease [Microbacterium marinilacus]|uniref:ABC transporter permease n=1 Tax=Microbacterium marinilacus TaxID=415209 RepID=A0ABP7B1G1_9MICO|nr:ABC transporter permease [Microbacterium marinilacus]MBY0690108.1 ABC transporter permease [Microbacterium marinilacus]